MQVRKLGEVSTLLPPCGFQGAGTELKSAGLAVGAFYKLMLGARCSFFCELAESKTLAESRSEKHTKGISAEGHGSMMAGLPIMCFPPATLKPDFLIDLPLLLH